jgi:predicted metal-dependent hydrolase
VPQPGLPFESIAPDAEPGARNPELVFVRHPRARRYVVSVRGDGVVRVTIPRWGSLREARAFAGEQERWIERQRRRLDQERTATPVVPDAILREAWARAKRELPPRLLGLAADLGVSVARVSVRNQKWRWGSCSRRGHICLNWRLVDMPDWVRDYVMVHELMHRRRMDHSKKFWKLVAAACPEYERARQWLRAYRAAAWSHVRMNSACEDFAP